MKRSVAILGPTPQFVRWAILHSCPLRQLDRKNLPDTTFRQLRGLRELSVGIIANRVREGICVHPESTSASPANALGFPVNEVLDAHGDQEFVASCCGDCPANVDARDTPGVWAGCYGWLPASTEFRFDSTISPKKALPPPNPRPIGSDSMEGWVQKPSLGTDSSSTDHPPPASRPPTSNQTATQTSQSDDEQFQNDLIQRIDEVIRDTGRAAEADSLFKVTSPRWFGIWQSNRLCRDQIEFLLDVFVELASRASSDASGRVQPTSDLVRFRNALQACSEHALELHVEFIPPGVSDGSTWTQFAHCPACKHALELDVGNSQTCPACQRNGNAHGERKGKVLGLRPYVKLSGVMGETNTLAFLQRFESKKQGRASIEGSEESERSPGSESHPSGSSPIEE